MEAHIQALKAYLTYQAQFKIIMRAHKRIYKRKRSLPHSLKYEKSYKVKEVQLKEYPSPSSIWASSALLQPLTIIYAT